MRLIKSREGVSEVVGDILLLSITVVMLSVLAAQLMVVEKPEERPQLDMSAKFDGVNLTLIHMGGKILHEYNTAIYVGKGAVVIKSYNVSDGEPDGELVPGDDWRVNLSGIIQPDEIFFVEVVDKTNNYVLMKEFLGRGPSLSAMPDIGLSDSDISFWRGGKLVDDEKNAPLPNDTIEIRAVVHNYGKINVTNIIVRASVYLYSAESLTPYTIPILNASGYPGDNATAIFKWKVKNWGPHVVTIKVIPLFNESRYENNYASASIRIGPGIVLTIKDPDLTIATIYFSDDHPQHGDIVKIYARIANQGGKPANATVKFYDGSKFISEINVSVSAGQLIEIYTTWIPTTGGLHTINVTVEVLLPQKDANPSNNWRTVVIEVLPTIMLVDDDRASEGSIKDVITSMEATLTSVGVKYTLYTITSGDGPKYDVGTPQRRLIDYDLVIWCTGFETTSTLTLSDTENLANYLDNGGKLWLIGQDILNDVRNVNTTFIRRYLHVATYTLDAGTPNPLQGVPNNYVTSRFLLNIYPTPWESGLADRGDYIVNDSTSVAAFMDTSGVNYNSLMYNNTYHVAFFPFEFTKINGSHIRSVVAYEILKWFDVLSRWGRDLAISEQTINNTTPLYMEEINITVYVRNNGAQNEPQGTDKILLLFLMDDVPMTVTKIYLNDTAVPPSEVSNPYVIPNITGWGGYVKVSVPFVVKTLGEHTIRVVVDPFDYIEEIDEMNNEASSGADISIFVKYSILVVDDDDSSNNDPSSSKYNATRAITLALDYIGYDYTVYVVPGGTQDGPNETYMQRFNAVIWCTGETTPGTTNPLTTRDETSIINYLSSGEKNFWLIGQDAFPEGTTSAGSLARDYLHIDSIVRNAGLPDKIEGVKFDDVAHGIGYPTRPTFKPTGSQVIPLSDAVAITYLDPMHTKYNAIRYYSSSMDYKIVYQGWDFSHIGSKEIFDEKFRDGFTVKDTSSWWYSSYQTVPYILGGNTVVKSTGTGSNYNANFYRRTYNLVDDYEIQIEFMVTSTATSAHFSIETYDSGVYKRFGIIATNTIYVQLNDGSGWQYPKTLINPIKTKTWYVLKIRIDDDNIFRIDVWEKYNENVKGTFMYKMPSGQHWRFHHWIYRDTAFIDNYVERKAEVEISDRKLEAEMAYLVLRWFDKYDERQDMRVTDVDLYYNSLIDIDRMKPSIGSSYVLQANITNVGGTRGDCVVRFLDENTVIDSTVISVAPGEIVTAEVIWKPLYAGYRDIRVWVDPDDALDEIFNFNNIATYTLEVFFFYDDLEGDAKNWHHESTIVRINGEGALEYMDPGNLSTAVNYTWKSVNGFDLIDYDFHSANKSYYMKEPPPPIDLALVIDTSNSMDGQPLKDAKAAAKFLLTQLSNDSYVIIYYFSGRNPASSSWYLMDSSGRSNANNFIDGLSARSFTPIWDTVGAAIVAARQHAGTTGNIPVVVVLSDGCDYQGDDTKYTNSLFEKASDEYCPWIAWGTTATFSNGHYGKYKGSSTTNGEWWRFTNIPQYRKGLLRCPIPVFTIGLNLEHHEPPNAKPTTTKFGNGVTNDYTNYIYQSGDSNAYYESGTMEYNLWRLAITSKGGKYYYAPKSSYLLGIFRDVAKALEKLSLSRSYGRSADTERAPNLPGSLDNYLITNTFDLSGAKKAMLSFWHKYDIRLGGSGCVVCIGTSSDDTTFRYKYVKPKQPYPGNLLLTKTRVDDYGNEIKWVWNGRSAGGTFDWEYVEVDLSDFLGQRYVRVMLIYIRAAGGGGEGWYVDDVEVKIEGLMGRIDEDISDDSLQQINDRISSIMKTVTQASTEGLLTGTYADSGGSYGLINQGLDNAKRNITSAITNLNNNNLAGAASDVNSSHTEIARVIRNIYTGMLSGDINKFYGKSLISHLQSIYERLKEIESAILNGSYTEKNISTSLTQDQWELIYTIDSKGRLTIAWWNHNGTSQYFGHGLDNSLVSRQIDLTKAKEAYLWMHLKFNINYSAGRPPDGFRVEISDDNGMTWRAINLGVRSAWNVSGTEGPDVDGKSFTGINEGRYWVSSTSLKRLNCDISGWAGSVILIRLRVVTRTDISTHYQQNNVGFGGLYVDDIIVFGTTSVSGGRGDNNDYNASSQKILKNSTWVNHLPSFHLFSYQMMHWKMDACTVERGDVYGIYEIYATERR